MDGRFMNMRRTPTQFLMSQPWRRWQTLFSLWELLTSNPWSSTNKIMYTMGYTNTQGKKEAYRLKWAHYYQWLDTRWFNLGPNRHEFIHCAVRLPTWGFKLCKSLGIMPLCLVWENYVILKSRKIILHRCICVWLERPGNDSHVFGRLGTM